MLKEKIDSIYTEYINKTFKKDEIKSFLLYSDFVKEYKNRVYEQLAMKTITGELSKDTVELVVKDLTRIFCKETLNAYETKIKSKRTTFNDFAGDEVAKEIYETQEKDLNERLKTKQMIKDFEEELEQTGELKV